MDHDAARYLTKAEESLASAESDFGHARYNSCANRCYYACFQAAIAALLREGIRPTGRWGHDYVQAQFAGQLVHRRKRYASEFRTTLVETFALRRIADYSTDSVSRAEGRRALTQTSAFTKAIAGRADT